MRVPGDAPGITNVVIIDDDHSGAYYWLKRSPEVVNMAVIILANPPMIRHFAMQAGARCNR